MSSFASRCTPSSRPLFHLGLVIATVGALELLDRTGTNAAALLHRHQHGDFGVVGALDARSNENAISDGSRILSAYDIGTRSERLWIITEADRRITTLLLPGEY